jgi:hypothetical protein
MKKLFQKKSVSKDQECQTIEATREKKNGCLNAFKRVTKTRLNAFKRVKNGRLNGNV